MVKPVTAKVRKLIDDYVVVQMNGEHKKALRPSDKTVDLLTREIMKLTWAQSYSFESIRHEVRAGFDY